MSEKIIVVEVRNEFLGDGVFWKGPASKYKEIKNLVARNLAKWVAQDGKSRSDGMWHVRLEEK